MYSKNDYRDYLEHSWGKKPEQKAREREYNQQYYRSHPEKWGMAKGSVSEVDDVLLKTANDVVDALRDDDLDPSQKHTDTVINDHGVLRFETVAEQEERLAKEAAEEAARNARKQKLDEGLGLFEEYFDNFVKINNATNGRDPLLTLVDAGVRTYNDRKNRRMLANQN